MVKALALIVAMALSNYDLVVSFLDGQVVVSGLTQQACQVDKQRLLAESKLVSDCLPNDLVAR